MTPAVGDPRLSREGRSDAPALMPQGQREHSHRHDRDLGYPLRQEDDRTNDQDRRDGPQQRVEDKHARTDSQARHGADRTIGHDPYHPGEPSNWWPEGKDTVRGGWREQAPMATERRSWLSHRSPGALVAGATRGAGRGIARQGHSCFSVVAGSIPAARNAGSDTARTQAGTGPRRMTGDTIPRWCRRSTPTTDALFSDRGAPTVASRGGLVGTGAGISLAFSGGVILPHAR